jgi:hypothetical protein
MAELLPQPGDVIITRHVHSPAVYAVRMTDGEEQIQWRDYDQAVTHAVGFARKMGTDAWFTADGLTFERLTIHHHS